VTTTEKRNLIFEAPNDAYCKLIDTPAKYNEFIKVSDLKAATILPKTPTTKDFSILTKTVLYDLLLMDKI
jgi:hypothetical protein